MSMTREEAIKALRLEGIEIGGKAKRLAKFMVALDVAQKALRPVSREQVEKVWRGEWKIITTHNGCTLEQDCVCSRCGASGILNKPFCDSCGAPMTDEAVEMVMEKWKDVLNEH